MHRQQNPNLEILEAAVAQLGPLAEQMVFLGGCATGLLLTDVAAPPIRATQDVDVITEIASLGDYYRLSDQLREQSFREDQSPDAPVCRWVARNVVLDVGTRTSSLPCQDICRAILQISCECRWFCYGSRNSLQRPERGDIDAEERARSVSDSVLAIVITIMVREMKVPHGWRPHTPQSETTG